MALAHRARVPRTHVSGCNLEELLDIFCMFGILCIATSTTVSRILNVAYLD